MNIFNRGNTRDTGSLKVLKSHMLIGIRNVPGAGISMQVSCIPAGSEQPVHHHEPEQCYYILSGKGLMIIDGESAPVKAGDAVHIPSNKRHGIKNTEAAPLEYLTANAPAFDVEYENRLWPGQGGG